MAFNPQHLHSDIQIPTYIKISLWQANPSVYSKTLAPFIHVLSQFQIILILLKSVSLSYQEDHSSLPWIINNICNAVFPEDHIKFNVSSSVTLMIMEIILIYAILYIAIVIYLFFQTFQSRIVPNLLKETGNIMAISHPLVLFYPIHVICLKIFDGLAQQSEHLVFDNKQQPRGPLGTISFIIMIANIIWSFLLVTIFEPNIKTKSPLSTKTNALTFFELAFKFFMPILWTCISPSQSLYIALIIIGLLFCLLKNLAFFYYLPYYKIFTLKLANLSQSFVTAFAIATLFSRVIGNAREYSEYLFLLLLWILFTIIMVSLYSNYLQKLLIKILIRPMGIKNPYHVIHYREISKYFAKFSTSGLAANKIDEQYFHHITTLKQQPSLAKIFSSNSDSEQQLCTTTFQKEINDYFYSFYLDLLNTHIKRYPGIKLLKAVLARSYAKQENQFVISNNVLEEHIRPVLALKNSFYLIKLTILKKLHITSSLYKSKTSLEIQNYIQTSYQFKNIKKEMVEQLKVQSQLWKAFQSNDSNYLQLLTQARFIHSKSRLISHLLSEYKNFDSTGFIEALLISGLYRSFVQYDTAIGQKMINDYCALEARKIQAENFSNHKNDMMINSFHLIISTLPKKLGVIVDCSGKAKEIFGLSKDILMGQNLTALMPSVYSNYFNNEIFNNLARSSGEEIKEVAFYTKRGFLFPMKIHISLSYLQEFGLSYYALLKPIEDHKRVLLVNSRGEILDFSKDFAKDMNILPKQEKNHNHWEIAELCPEIGKTLKVLDNRKVFKTQKSSKSLANLDKTKHKFSTSLHENISSTSKINLTGVSLNFHPQNQTTKTLETPKSSSKKESTINYTVSIQEHVIDNLSIFELKMDRITSNNEFDTPYVSYQKRLSRLQSALYFQKEQQSPEVEPVTATNGPLKTDFAFLPTSPVATSTRKLLFTLRTNEDARSPEKEEELIITTISPSRRIFEREQTGFFNFGDFAEGVRSELPPAYSGQVKTQFVPHQGDLHDEDIEGTEEEEDDLSEFFESHTHVESAKDQKKASTHHHLKQMEAEILQAHIGGEASSAQETQFIKENTRTMRAHKLIRELTHSKKYSLATIYYNISFVLSILVLMAFLIWLNYDTSRTSQNVGKLGKVVGEAYYRNYWTKVACQDTNLMLNWGDDNAIRASTTSFNGMIEANRAFEISIADLDTSLQEIFYEKNIAIYDIDESGNDYQIGTDNSFQATKRIYSAGLHFIATWVAIDPSLYPTNRPSRFILDNSSNDLLIVSEYLLEVLKAHIFDSLSQSKNTMTTLLIITMVILFLFVLVSLGYVMNRNKKSRKFMEAFFTIPSNKVAIIEKSLTKFKDSLEQDLEGVDLLAVMNFTKLEMIQIDTQRYLDSSHKINHNQTQKASMKSFNTKNYIIFSSLFACLGLLVGFTAFYYRQAQDKLVVMQKQQINSNAALDYLNTIAEVSILVQQILLENAMTTIRHQPLVSSLEKAALKIKQVSELQNNLMNSKGEYSPGQEDILFNFECPNAYSDSYSWGKNILVPECELLSDGLGVVGLVKLLSKLEVAIGQFLDRYPTIPKDMHSLLLAFYYEYIDYRMIGSMTDIGIVVLLHSYDASTKDFDDSVHKLEDERVILGWVASIVTIGLGIFTWIFVVRKLCGSEFQERKLLALVPNRLILSNFLLKKYLVKVSRNNEAHKLFVMK